VVDSKNDTNGYRYLLITSYYIYVFCERDGTVGISTVSLYHKNKILDAAIP